MKGLSEASWSRISISREGFRPGGQGAGGGGGQQRGGGRSGCKFTRWSLGRGHCADRPTGLRRGGRLVRRSYPLGTRETRVLKTRPSQLEDGIQCHRRHQRSG